MQDRHIYYLGPSGSFTHQAAMEAARTLADPVAGEVVPTACDTVRAIMHNVQSGEGWGVIAWENNVEGYVVPNLDGLIDSRGVVGIARVGVDVRFDAFVLNHRGAGASRLSEVTAHPHGLAQCSRFIAELGLPAVPSRSNAAACRDLKPGQIALGPSICGSLYGLQTYAGQVQDYQGARTEFLVLVPRDDASTLLRRARARDDGGFESIVACIPLSTGPGVLANLLDTFRDARLNMTSFISRPIKGHDGTYSFIATVDAAPWQERFHGALDSVVGHGDWVKTLAVYPRRERPNPPVDDWMLPDGGIHVVPGTGNRDWRRGSAVGRELLW